jgi:hypothetical protein
MSGQPGATTKEGLTGPGKPLPELPNQILAKAAQSSDNNGQNDSPVSFSIWWKQAE